jgi:prophage DNA circulation protein
VIHPYQASWRGVPFQTVSTSNSGGRKTSTHDFAQLDGQWVEDRALMARAYQLACWVSGWQAKRALIQALEKPGPGVLVHPTLGRKVVQLLTWKLDDSVTDGDVSRFELSFSETKAPPMAAPSRVSSVTETLATVITSSATTAVAVITAPVSTAAMVAALGDAMVSSLKEAYKAISGPLAISATALRKADQQLAQAVKAANKITSYPNEAVAQLQAMVATVTDGDAVRALRRWGASLPLPSASDLTPQADLQRAHVRLWRETIVAQFGTVILSDTYLAQQDAEQTRTDWVEGCEAALEGGSLISELQAVLGSVAAWLDAQALRLPKLVPVELEAPTPALVLAWQLYGDWSRNDQLVELNEAASGMLVGTVEALSA